MIGIPSWEPACPLTRSVGRWVSSCIGGISFPRGYEGPYSSHRFWLMSDSHPIGLDMPGERNSPKKNNTSNVDPRAKLQPRGHKKIPKWPMGRWMINWLIGCQGNQEARRILGRFVDQEPWSSRGPRCGWWLGGFWPHHGWIHNVFHHFFPFTPLCNPYMKRKKTKVENDEPKNEMVDAANIDDNTSSIARNSLAKGLRVWTMCFFCWFILSTRLQLQ